MQMKPREPFHAKFVVLRAVFINDDFPPAATESPATFQPLGTDVNP
jgi:hypothetical protein